MCFQLHNFISHIFPSLSSQYFGRDSWRGLHVAVKRLCGCDKTYEPSSGPPPPPKRGTINPVTRRHVQQDLNPQHVCWPTPMLLGGYGETWRALIFGAALLKNYELEVRQFEQSELIEQLLSYFL